MSNKRNTCDTSSDEQPDAKVQRVDTDIIEGGLQCRVNHLASLLATKRTRSHPRKEYWKMLKMILLDSNFLDNMGWLNKILSEEMNENVKRKLLRYGIAEPHMIVQESISWLEEELQRNAYSDITDDLLKIAESHTICKAVTAYLLDDDQNNELDVTRQERFDAIKDLIMDRMWELRFDPKAFKHDNDEDQEDETDTYTDPDDDLDIDIIAECTKQRATVSEYIASNMPDPQNDLANMVMKLI